MSNYASSINTLANSQLITHLKSGKLDYLNIDSKLQSTFSGARNHSDYLDLACQRYPKSSFNLGAQHLGALLLRAIYKNNEKYAAILIEDGADLNVQDGLEGGCTGSTPLRLAISNQLTSTVEKLLDNGANPNIDGIWGTPLKNAILDGNARVVKKLIHAGADINAKDSRGVTPIEHAISLGYKEIVRLLLEKGADANHYVDSSLVILCCALLFISKMRQL